MQLRTILVLALITSPALAQVNDGSALPPAVGASGGGVGASGVFEDECILRADGTDAMECAPAGDDGFLAVWDDGTLAPGPCTSWGDDGSLYCFAETTVNTSLGTTSDEGTATHASIYAAASGASVEMFAYGFEEVGTNDANGYPYAGQVYLMGRPFTDSVFVIGTQAGWPGFLALQSNGITGIRLDETTAVPDFPVGLTGTSATLTGQFKSSLVGGGFFSAFYASSIFPSFAWNDTLAAADNRLWDVFASGTNLTFRAVNDGITVANTWLTVTRSGATPGVVMFPAAAGVTVTGAVRHNASGNTFGSTTANTMISNVVQAGAVEVAFDIYPSTTWSGSTDTLWSLRSAAGGTQHIKVRPDGHTTFSSAFGIFVQGAVDAVSYSVGSVAVVDALNSPVTGITIHGRDSTTLAGGDLYVRAGQPSSGVVGATLTFSGGKGGSATEAGGPIVFQTAAALTGTTYATRLTIAADGTSTFTDAVTVQKASGVSQLWDATSIDVHLKHGSGFFFGMPADRGIVGANGTMGIGKYGDLGATALAACVMDGITEGTGTQLWCGYGSGHTATQITQTCTCPSGASVSAVTCDPTSDDVEIVNNDVDGCVVTLSETSAVARSVTRFSVVTNAGGVVKFAATAGVHAGPTCATTTGLDVDDTYAVLYSATNTKYVGAATCVSN